VTLVGTDKEFIDSLIPDVEKHVDGVKVDQEDEADHLNPEDHES